MDLEAQVKVTKPGAVENQPNGLLGVGRGFGVGRETDRQRVLHPVIASEAWQSTARCLSTNEPLLGEASQCCMDRHARLRLTRGDGAKGAASESRDQPKSLCHAGGL